MNEAELLNAVESSFIIVFLMLSILSVKKFIKSLLLNCEGIFILGDICLFVNLATVLNKVHLYTEQNYKCNTFVFAPIFHELMKMRPIFLKYCSQICLNLC